MQDYQMRVVEEADELDGKIRRLVEFLDRPKSHADLPEPEYQRMRRQLDAMNLYSYILHNRIKHFLP